MTTGWIFKGVLPFAIVSVGLFSPHFPEQERAIACPGPEPGERGNARPRRLCRKQEEGFRRLPACAAPAPDSNGGLPRERRSIQGNRKLKPSR